MHQSFTGSTRKGRQVNLSGRPASNPWANLPGSAKAGQTQSGTQSTLAQAQAERQKRQLERDRQHASRKVQKTWRGHDCRRKQKARWRQEWDENEQRRLNGSLDTSYEHVLLPNSSAPAYTDPRLMLAQLRLLLHFQEYRNGIVRHELDTARVLCMAQSLQQSEALLRGIDSDRIWHHNLTRFSITAARHIRSILSLPSSERTAEATRQLANAISLLAKILPEDISRHSDFLMHLLIDTLAEQEDSSTRNALVKLLNTLLSQGSTKSYASVIQFMLSDERLCQNPQMLSTLSGTVDLGCLARVYRSQVATAEEVAAAISFSETQRLWQLSYLVYMRRQQSQVPTSNKNYDFIEALSALLHACASLVKQISEAGVSSLVDVGLSESSAAFIVENIDAICQQDFLQKSIASLAQSSNSSRVRSEDAHFELADRLAAYVLSMIGAFESKKAAIRQLLYQTSLQLPSGRVQSTISFFWSMVSRTRILQQISQDERKALSLLVEAAAEQHQLGRPSVTPQLIQQWKSEWRIILVFFEVYNFALKLMDDEDFFSVEESRKLGQGGVEANQWRKGALPLNDVANLVLFLKHLSFNLYWNAAKLVRKDQATDPERLDALLGSGRSTASMSVPAAKQDTAKLAGNQVSHAYLKDLTTGLLRMLHERDSRRNFLNPKAFLMTDQVDLQGFISEVVTEEEKRHEMQDDEELEGGSPEVDEMETDQEPEIDEMLSSMFGIRQPHRPRSYASKQAAERERQNMHAMRRRQIELLAPRLEILRNLPFFIPFETRVQIFRGFIFKDQLRRRDGFVDADTWRMHIAHSSQGRPIDGRPPGMGVLDRHHAEIHRESVFEDAFDAYYQLGEGLKEPIQISFIDKFGAPEAGIDGGGVTKEFLMSVTSEALDPHAEQPMFTENEQRYLYPSALVAEETAEHLQRIGLRKNSESFNHNMREVLRRYEFLGRVIGKCLYEGILIDVNFAGFFLLKWALTGGTTTASTETAYRASINDLRDFDDALYNGLLKLKNYTGDVEADFGLNFTVSDELKLVSNAGKEFTKTVTKELIPDGTNIAVTNLNKYHYIDRIVRYRLQQQPKLVTDAFLRGLGQIIQPMWLAMFNQKELQKLVGGDSSELDIVDLRRNTQYGGLYVVGDDGIEHPTVELFWNVLKAMDDSDRRKVLKFVTSTPRAPLLGFSHLNPKFSIRDSSEDQDRLPSTSTCVNLLKLPRYGDMKTMREKLLYAVNAGAGFDLS